MDLPELVKKAIISACESGRKLSWKIQENDRGTLVQLVWKPEPFLVGNSSKNSEASSNWNLAARNCPWTAQKSKKQHPPSRLRRNARRLASFIEKKQAAQETCTQEIRKDTKCETIISKPVELTAADEVEPTMLNLTPAQHAQETQDDKSWKTYKLTSTASESESHQDMDTL